MWKISKFHELYSNNKEVYDRDARILRRHEFMEKYKIGTWLYDTYFRWLNNRNYSISSDDKLISNRYKTEMIIKRAKERQEEDLDYFNEKVISIAHRLRVPKSEIIKLTERYTVSELEYAIKEDGKIVCEDQVIMRKPTDYRESMCALGSSMI